MRRWFGSRGEVSHEAAARAEVAQLTASRRTIVDAYEVERRRIERNLHDGTQQYLVAATMKLGEAQLSAVLAADPALAALIGDAKRAVQQGLAALRETVRGIHPQVLVELGLEAALRDVAESRSSSVRIVCPHPLPAMCEGVVAAAYFFACEAITNAGKYAPGADVSVLLVADDALRVSVVDDGSGGARVLDAHGLAGMRERLAAFGGRLDVVSPPGGPTQVAAHIPLLLNQGEPGIVMGEA